MDFLTHACVGALVGRVLAPRDDAAASGRCVRLGALMALLPDADHVLELVSAEAYLVHHRQVSHSLLFTGAVTAGMALFGDKATRGRRAAVTGGAFASHLLLDLLTPFGTGVLWPFANKLAWDGLQLVAPWLVLLCVVFASLAAWKGRRSVNCGRKAAWAGLAVIGAFLGSQWGIARAITPQVAPDEVVVGLPSWSKPWQGVSFVAKAGRLVHQNHPLGGEVEQVPAPERFEREPPAVAVDGARRGAERYLRNFRLPVARRPWEGGYAAEVEEGAQVVFEDAQFWAIDPGKPPFRIMVGPQGAVRVWEQARPLQLLLWSLVFGAAWWLTRSPREAPPPVTSEKGSQEET